MKKDPAGIVKSVLKVASLPEIYIKVNEVINSSTSSSADLAHVINEDAALAARLLRIANSAFYSFVSKVETVANAVTVLGTQQLRDLILASTVLKLFKDIPEEYVNMESFWRHSIAVGILSRTIASYRKETNVERFFVAGLLHDIGRLIALVEIPKDIARAFERAKNEEIMLFMAEREEIGFDHAKLGGMLLEAWQLSPRLVEAVYYHHAPERAIQYPMDAATIHVADIIANALQLGSSGERFVPPSSQAALDQLKLDPDTINPIIEEMDQQYNDVVGFILNE